MLLEKKKKIQEAVQIKTRGHKAMQVNKGANQGSRPGSQIG